MYFTRYFCGFLCTFVDFFNPVCKRKRRRLLCALLSYRCEISIVRCMVCIKIVPVRNTGEQSAPIIVLKLAIVLAQFQIAGLVLGQINDLVDLVFRSGNIARDARPIPLSRFRHVFPAVRAHRNLRVDFPVPVCIAVHGVSSGIFRGPFFKAIFVDKAVRIAHLYYLISI